MARNCFSILAILMAWSVAFLPTKPCADEITIEGVARSASRFTALAFECSAGLKIDLEKAKKYAQSFMMIGNKAFGDEKFAAAFRKANAEMSQEVIKAGQYQWCVEQRAMFERRGLALDVFLPDHQGMSDDDMTTVVSYFIVAGLSCGFKPTEITLNPIMRRYGFDVKDFLPDGRLASIVEAKVDKAKELLSRREQSCDNLIATIRKSVPEFAQ